MKVKVVYNNIRDKELIVMIQTSAPFFVDFIDSKTRNGKKEAYRIKNEFGAKLEPFVVVYDDEDNFVTCFWSESGSNAVQQFVNLYK